MTTSAIAPSYGHAASDRPLLGETIGENFNRIAATHADREALADRRQSGSGATPSRGGHFPAFGERAECIRTRPHFAVSRRGRSTLPRPSTNARQWCPCRPTLHLSAPEERCLLGETIDLGEWVPRRIFVYLKFG